MDVNLSITGAGGLQSDLNDLVTTTEANNTYHVVTDVEYAAYQELGTIHHPPQPHLRPAVQRGGRYLRQNASGANSIDDLLNRTAQDILQEVKRRAPVDTGRLRDSYRIETG